MKTLKIEVIAAVISRDIEQIKNVKLKIWMRKPRREAFDKDFMNWINSDEGRAVRAHLEEEY